MFCCHNWECDKDNTLGLAHHVTLYKTQNLNLKGKP